MYQEINKCRICGNADLIPVINLGTQYLTGVFPRNKNDIITSGPLELVKCQEGNSGGCGLLQLRQSYDLNEMYGHNYGYRSGLNLSMVSHLNEKVRKVQKIINLTQGDLVIDIGSNDGTLLKAYPSNGYELVGIDPTGKKFSNYYPDYIKLIPDFFSSVLVKDVFQGKKANVITSISMFYDLDAPMDFMKQIHETLTDDGIWVFEQSYMPTMMKMNAYDTICHEHLEYYALKQIKWMTDRVGFKIIGIELNSVNGGSISVVVAKSDSPYNECSEIIEGILKDEESMGLSGLNPYKEFKQRVFQHRDELIRFIKEIGSDNKTILGYGASTKGNVMLQFCGLSEKEIPFIAEVNEDKFGCYTPGSLIPIISEKEAKAMKPDYFMVLPWHFKENIMNREKEYLMSGGSLIFPLPFLEVLNK